MFLKILDFFLGDSHPKFLYFIGMCKQEENIKTQQRFKSVTNVCLFMFCACFLFITDYGDIYNKVYNRLWR